MKFPSFMIAGMSSGVGKTTLTMGILSAFSKERIVQSYKVGPDYIDPAFHTFITGRACRNLDNYLLSDETIVELFYKNCEGAQLSIVEGAMGLYDGVQDNSIVGSSANIAKIIGCPVILVVDGSGIGTSVAAIIKGFIDFDSQVNLCGVIINKVNSEKHYLLLKDAIERYTTAKCYGYLPKNEDSFLKSRHLGLIPSCETEDLKLKIDALRVAVEKTIDLHGLFQLAKREAKEALKNYKPRNPIFQNIQIGVAYDEAFNFYYEDNLNLLSELGAAIRFFSPIRDKELPRNIHFLYFGGGFPEIFAKELSENIQMKQEILNKLKTGTPYLAEAGGLMYLAQRLKGLDDRSYNMVGWLEGECVMTKRLQRFGYKTLQLKEGCILGEEGNKIKIHEFHRSKAEGINEPTIFGLKKIRVNKVVEAYQCGYLKGNGVAGYPHFHFYSNPKMAINLLRAAEAYGKDYSNDK